MPALSIMIPCLAFRRRTRLPCILAHVLISASKFLVIVCAVGFGILMLKEVFRRGKWQNGSFQISPKIESLYGLGRQATKL